MNLPVFLRITLLSLLLCLVGALAAFAQSDNADSNDRTIFLPSIRNNTTSDENVTSAKATGENRNRLQERTDQVIVHYTDRVQAAAGDRTAQMATLQGAAQVKLTFVRPLADSSIVVKLDEWMTVEEVEQISQAMRTLPEVANAEPDRIKQIQLTPNDPDYDNQWHYFAPTAGNYGANLPGAWDVTTGSSSIVVAVLDTGIVNHADLAGRTVPGYDFINDALVANDGDGRDNDPSDPGDWVTSAESSSGFFAGCPIDDSSWHGTHVAGTIGANSNNGFGVAGIDWNGKLQAVRVLGKCGGYTSDIIDGIRWAAGLSVSGVPANANPARVINMSLGGFGPCSTTEQDAIDAAVAAGTVVVIAAGNSADDAVDHSPGNCDNVITVAASDWNGDRASFSNYGSIVEISAPGVSVLSTLNSGTTVPVADSYAYYSGTSMATPHVAGIVALMLAVNPNLTPPQVTALLQGYFTAFPAGSSCNSSICGPGIINAAAAVAAAPNPITPLPPTPTPTVTNTPTPLPNCTIYTSSDVPVAIFDNSTVYSTINVPNNFLLADVNVRGLYIVHTYDGDLVVDLISPSDTEVTLFNRIGGSGNDFWDTNLDDSATTLITAGSAPFTGLYQPEEPLGAFAGSNAQGEWQLRIRDDAGLDEGSLEGWSLELCSSPDGTPPPTPTMTATGAATPTPTPTPTITISPMPPTATPTATPTVNPNAVTILLPTDASGAPGTQVTIPVQVPNSVSGLNIISYDFRISFDPTVLDIVSVSAGSLSSGWNVIPNTSTAGEVQIVAFNTVALSGSGTLINLVFDVVGGGDSSTALTWNSFTFNEGDPAAQTIDGFFMVISTWTVGGDVYYHNNSGRPMAGVTLDLSGASTAQTTTDGAGYSFTVDANGAYDITPSHSGQVSGISAFDAAYVAQCVAGLRNSSDCPLLAADTSGNSSISAFDAALIAQYAAGLAGPTSRVGTWVFAPDSHTYATIESDLLNENFGAYLIGEVTGNWSAPAAAAAQQASGAAPLAALANGSEVTLQLTESHSELLAFQATIRYDVSAGHFVTAQPTQALGDGWELVANQVESGVIVLVGYGTTPINGSGELVALRFQTTAAGEQLAPTITQAQLNEEALWVGQAAPAHQQFLPFVVK